MFAKHYAQSYDSLYRDKPYEQEVDFVYGWGDKPKTILDIGCGTASYWKYFPKDVEIIGVESSRQMIYESAHEAKILCADITEATHNLTLRRFLAQFGVRGELDMAMALFDVLNYISGLNWISKLPIKKGGYFIFDIWDSEKARKDGFKITTKEVGNVRRTIYPLFFKNQVDLTIKVEKGEDSYLEHHTMYLYSDEDIRRFCGDEFEIVDRKDTDTWQTFYKLRRI